nr:hypothetical protein [Nostoc sp. ChiSLP03a]
MNGNFHGYAKARVRVATTKHTLSFPAATPHHIEKSQTFGVNHGYPNYSHPHDPSSRYQLCCADGFRFHRWFVGCTLAANRMGAIGY